MSISTGSVVEVFDTTQIEITNTPANVADSSFSIQSDITVWTNTDNTMTATMVLKATFPVAATSSIVRLYARPLNLVSTNSAPIPKSTYPYREIGMFHVDTSTTATQYVDIQVRLPNHDDAAQFEFYIKNNTGKTMSSWGLYIRPHSVSTKQ